MCTGGSSLPANDATQIDVTVGSQIAKLRQQQNMSDKEFAKILEISQADLQKIEAGELRAGLPIVMRICLLFNVSFGTFFNQQLSREHVLDNGLFDIDPKTSDALELMSVFLQIECDDTRKEVLALAKSYITEP